MQLCSLIAALAFAAASPALAQDGRYYVRGVDGSMTIGPSRVPPPVDETTPIASATKTNVLGVDLTRNSTSEMIGGWNFTVEVYESNDKEKVGDITALKYAGPKDAILPTAPGWGTCVVIFASGLVPAVHVPADGRTGNWAISNQCESALRSEMQIASGKDGNKTRCSVPDIPGTCEPEFFTESHSIMTIGINSKQMGKQFGGENYFFVYDSGKGGNATVLERAKTNIWVVGITWMNEAADGSNFKVSGVQMIQAQEIEETADGDGDGDNAAGRVGIGAAWNSLLAGLGLVVWGLV